MENIDMDAFKEGKEAVFKAVFNKYQQVLYYFTRKIVDNDHEVEDIVVYSFEKLFERHRQFNTEQHIKAFLFLTARNKSINYLKYRKGQTVLNRKLSILYRNKQTPGLEEKLIKAEAIKRIVNGIDDLPPTCREIFKLSFYKGKTVAEIAEILGITPGNVSSQLNKARNILRQYL